MAFEFDHVFIMTDHGAEITDRLLMLGFVQGISRVHPGQGTTNRCFFFQNAMLEFLWVHDPAEAQSDMIQRTHLWERWRDRNSGICPFGICLRPTPESIGSIAFEHWDYKPPYLPENLSIAVGNNSEILTEPMLFQTPFGKRPDQQPIEKRFPLVHPIGLRKITRVELVSPMADHPSPEMRSVLETGQIQLRFGNEYWLELGFDGESEGKSIDFKSELPLIIHW
jgi:Glyoxalase-like domain